MKTGQPQARKVFGMEWWDYLNANPKELEDFGEAMKSNSLNSLRGVLENCDFTGVGKVADVGGGFGHLAIALVENYARLKAVVVDVPSVISIAQERLPVNGATRAEGVECDGGERVEEVA